MNTNVRTNHQTEIRIMKYVGLVLLIWFLSICMANANPSGEPGCLAVSRPAPWFKAAMGFQGGWCYPSVGESLPAGSIGEVALIKDTYGRLQGAQAFQCQRRADKSVGWTAVAASCSKASTRTE